MAESQPIYDPAPADGRFQLEMLALRWVLVALCAVFVQTGIVKVTPTWFFVCIGYLVTWHIYYSWYVWHELTQEPLPMAAGYATPFLDTIAVTLGLIAIGNPLHPIWAAYFSIMVGVSHFYYPVAKQYGVWLALNFAFVGLGLYMRGLHVPWGQMMVVAMILLGGLSNLIAYTGGERRLRSRMSEAARTDPLTNLRNRRGLEETLDTYMKHASEGKGLAMLMLDVDRFKRYNDQFGHLAADEVLEHLGELLSSAVRDPDLVARYGGDEFVVIFQDVAPEDAATLADRLRQQVARSGFCTVSIGVGIARPAEVNVKALLDRADAALLLAKHEGRNCVRGPLGGSEVAA